MLNEVVCCHQDHLCFVKEKLSIKEHKVSEQLMGCIFPSIDFEMSNKITSKELKIKFSSAPFIVKLIIEDMEDENT